MIHHRPPLRQILMRRFDFGAKRLLLIFLSALITHTSSFSCELQGRSHLPRGTFRSLHKSPLDRLPLSIRQQQRPWASYRLATQLGLHAHQGSDYESSLFERIYQFPRFQRKPAVEAGKKMWRKILQVSLALFCALLVVSTPMPAHASIVADTAPVIAASPATSAIGATVASIATRPVSAMVELKLTLRLVYAAMMGATLGKERSLARHSAGVRTMALVAMGASAFTLCSAFGFLNFPGRYDPSRMAANVASGVGFIGAGVITTTSAQHQQQQKSKGGSSQPGSNVVHGLTTAATIWLSAAVGVACGVGLYAVATTTAVTTILILRLGRIKPKSHPSSNAEPTSTQKQDIKRSGLAAETKTGRTSVPEEEENNFDDDEHYAETHDTSDWDEHPDQEEEEEEEQRESLIRVPGYLDSLSQVSPVLPSESSRRSPRAPRKSRRRPYAVENRADPMVRLKENSYGPSNSTSDGIFFSYDEMKGMDLKVLEQYVRRRSSSPASSVSSEEQLSKRKKDRCGP